ncbi:MAG: sigma-70 family RNA polymerase sigma factor [Paenibacillaceae bacterium]
MNLNSSSFRQGEMNELIQQYQQTNTNEIATKLIIYYQPIVKKAAGKMSRNKPDLYEDLFQVGQMAMLRLFQQFDCVMGIPFEAYAMKSIIGHLKNYLRDKSWFIKVPRRIKEKGLIIQHAVDELTVSLERSPRMDEIADYLALSVEETIEIMAGRNCYNYISLDTPLFNEENSSTIGDLIGSQADDYQSFEMRADLDEAMVRLEKDERIIIFLVYNEGQSQRQIAVQLGISQMSVSRIQKRAIGKLKELLADRNLSAFLE